MTSTINHVSPGELAERCGQGPVDLIDVRTPAEFAEVRAAAARSVPLDRLGVASVVNGRRAGADEPVYFICRSGGRGRQACERLRAAGFANVVNVEGGTLAWEQSGLPVVRGPHTMSLE